MGRKILIALLIVGLVASSYVAVQRHRTESRDKAVEIVVDWDEVQQIATATGARPVAVLERFKRAGATSVAVTELTVKDALQNGDAVLDLTRTGDQEVFFKAGSGDPAATLGAILATQGNRAPSLMTYATGTRMINRRGLPFSVLEQYPIGLPERGLWAANNAGLGVVARLVAYPGATPRAIDFMLADAADQGARTIVFAGDTVLGFKGAVEATADALRKHDLYFGRVEFAKQKGDARLAEEAKDRVIVVHSITQAEMPTLSDAEIVDRFAKAVRERGVRLCYIRMYYTASADLVGDNADYISAIARGITRAGYTLAPAHMLGEVDVPKSARVLAGIGVGAGAALLVMALVDSPTVIIPILLILICGGLAAFGEIGRKVVALLSALTFPTLAVLLVTRNAPEAPTPARNVVARAIRVLIGAIAVTTAGGLLIVGLLSARDFMLRTDQFMGVKAAHLVPVVALAILYVGQVAWRSDKWAAQKQRFWTSLRSTASNPVLMWQAVGMLAVLVIVGLMVARSGNDAGVGVSGTELRFRSILDKILYVRPRTKEIFIGYPALLAGIAFAIRGRRQWAAPLAVIGSIGLISALNTFCHIHTPIALSLVRVFNGAWVGILIGIIFYYLIRYLPGKE